jgi:hypothetical protein
MGTPARGGESSRLPPKRGVHVIVHRGRVAALAAERVYFTPHIEVLEPDHPERRFVAALCLYGHAVDTGQAAVPGYDQDRAERFARMLLMPGSDFDSAAFLSDAQLAECFAAPLDQVRVRRRERAHACSAGGESPRDDA